MSQDTSEASIEGKMPVQSSGEGVFVEFQIVGFDSHFAQNTGERTTFSANNLRLSQAGLAQYG